MVEISLPLHIRWSLFGMKSAVWFLFDFPQVFSSAVQWSGQTARGGDLAVAMFVDKKFKAFHTILTVASPVLKI